MTETVLVSGASGFIAQHILGLLLKKGFTVIGTVRSEPKADTLKEKFAAQFGSDVKLSFVIVKDIAEKGAFDEVFKSHKEIKYVLHTASNFSFGFEDMDKAFLEPAVKGTVGILNSIKEYGPQVEKVVVTSSFASIVNGDKLTDKSFIHNESVWNPITWEEAKAAGESACYMASKKLAEKAAWDFVKENKVNFVLDTVCPPYVFGPQYFAEDASKETLNTSAEIINGWLKSSPNDDSILSKSPHFPTVDVRDVAAFHLLALEKDISGERLFPVDTKTMLSYSYGLSVINEHFPELKGKILYVSPEDGEKDAKLGPSINNDKSVKLVGGYEFIPFKKQIIDTVKQILAARE